MDRRRYITVVGVASIATSLSGCLGSDGSDNNTDSEQNSADDDAESIEPDESIPIDEYEQAAETNVEQLVIIQRLVDGNPDGQTVGVEYAVQNTAPETRSAVLVATLDVADGKKYEKRFSITVPADTVHTYKFEHEIEGSVPAAELEYAANARLER